MSQAGYTPIQLYFSTTASAAPSAGNLANGELAVNITDGKLFYKDNGGVVRVLATAAGSAGDVVGPGSSTDNALVRFDGTTGKLVQSSVGVLSDAGALSGLTSVAATTFTGALTGNASTATTLQTSRTIWGQSFDGSANVTGALTGVTDLTASGSLTLSGGTANGVAYLNGSKVLTTGSALTFDGSLLKTSGAVSVQGVAFPASGSGAELFWDGSESVLQSYNRTSSAYLPLWLEGSYTRFGISGSEAMRLTSTGLGIGTSSPGSVLDVVGSGNPTLTVRGSAGAYTAILKLQAAGGGSSVINATGASSDNLQLQITGVTKATLDSSGNLGLGVTPSAHLPAGYGGPILQVGGRASIMGSATTAAYANNTYYAAGFFRYIGTGLATMQEQIDGQFRFYTAPSGTAGNAISFTQAMTLYASGGLSVGNTVDPGSKTINLGFHNGTGSLVGGLHFTGYAAGYGAGIRSYTDTSPGVDYQDLRFYTCAGPSFPFAERARIDSSGNLLLKTTSNGDGNAFNVKQTTANTCVGIQVSPTNTGAINWYNGSGTYVATVTVSGTTVTYPTSSDYRLKENVKPMVGALEKISTLKPCTYTWKATGAASQGFIAHELQEIFPDAVVGEKDAVREDGSIKPQGIDTSFLVATLTAAIQEQQAIIEDMKTRLAAAGI